MTNGNGETKYFQEARIRVMNLRMELNSEIDKISKWMDEYEQRKLKTDRAVPIARVADDSVIESEIITKGGSEEA